MGKQGGVVPGPSLTPPALAARGDRRKQRRVDPSAQTSDALFFALLGLDGAGKSTVLARLKKDLGPAPKASWGFSVQTIGVRVGWRRMQATFYDVGGSAKIRNIWTNYLADVHGCFYVVDSADGNRLAESAEALRRIYMDSRLNGKPLVILANKQNLPGAEADLAKFASLLDVAKLCPAGEDSFLRERSASSITVGRHIMIQKCVAEKVGFWGRTCDSGIRKGLHWMVHTVLDKISTLAPRIARDTAQQKLAWEREKEEQRVRVEQYQRSTAQQGHQSTEAGVRSFNSSSRGSPSAPQRKAPLPPAQEPTTTKAFSTTEEATINQLFLPEEPLRASESSFSISTDPTDLLEPTSWNREESSVVDCARGGESATDCVASSLPATALLSDAARKMLQQTLHDSKMSSEDDIHVDVTAAAGVRGPAKHVTSATGGGGGLHAVQLPMSLPLPLLDPARAPARAIAGGSAALLPPIQAVGGGVRGVVVVGAVGGTGSQDRDAR